jgi:ATP/maltotriose-dependent transcriptional regulator MalT
VATRVTSTRFVGRDAELTELRAALADAGDGRPSLAFVAGESGVGKTRLVTELQRLAADDGARVLAGECVDLGGDELPFAPLVAALRPLARSDDPVLDTLPANAREALRAMLPGLGGTTLPRDPDGDAAGARAQLFEALLELLARLGEDGGLLLVIEDLHWADQPTRAFFAFLAASLEDERVLVVATYRPDELHRRHPLRPLLAELERDMRARRLDLRPFSRAELAEQLADILGEPPRGDLLERLWARSEGNALFAEELLAAGPSGHGALPPTLREALMVRIDRLEPATQDVLRLLAVAPRMSHEVLEAASDLRGAELRHALRDAVAAQILVVDAENRYAFRHALLREVLHDDLLPGERAALHRSVAQALEARVDGAHAAAAVAYHYHESGDQPAALAASVRAGAAAEAVHAYASAASLYERALELWDRVPDAEALTGKTRVDVLRAAAECHEDDNDPGRAEVLLRAALAQLDEAAQPRLAATVLERLSRQQWKLGRAEEARDSKQRGLKLLPEGEISEERATILAAIAKQLMLESRYGEAKTAAREALEVARPAGARLAQIRALDALGISLAARGETEDGLAALREAIAMAREDRMHATMVTSYVNLADALSLSGRLDEARRTIDEALAFDGETGSENRWLQVTAAELAILAGDWAAADAVLPEHGRRSMGGTWICEALRRADLALGRGDHDTARRLLHDLVPMVQGSREPQFIGPAAVELAELERRAGDLDEARRAIDDGLDQIEFCSEDMARISMVATAGVRVEADAALRARDLADAEAERLAISRAQGLLMRAEATAEDGRPVEQANLAIARADAARAEGAQDPALYAAAAESLAALGRPYLAADARWRQAEALLAAGDRDGAAAVAAEARDAARGIGATWLVSEIEGFAARARLRVDTTTPGVQARAGASAATGGQPADDLDPFGLTPRERQVLELLAAGCTNREIGQTLYMAEKTASVHVSRILGKLDVRSRTEAAAVAHRLGLA